MQPVATLPHPYAPSIEAVLALAAEEAGALGWAVVDSPPEEAGGGDFVISLPLTGGGIVAFHFSHPPDDREKKVVSDSTAAVNAIRRVAAERAGLLDQLALRVRQAEAELLNRKIMERAAGLRSELTGVNRSERLLKHVEVVLKYRGIEGMLQAHAQQLESRLDDRALIAAAKSVLQQRERLTEEQAFRRLRSMSRRQRVPLATVAQSILRE